MSLLEESIDEYATSPQIIRVNNYGDESAVIRLLGRENNSLINEYEIIYELKDKSMES